MYAEAEVQKYQDGKYLESWKRPPQGWIKIIVGGSFIEVTQ